MCVLNLLRQLVQMLSFEVCDSVYVMAVPVAWTVTQFALVDSLYGLSRHDVLAHWTLKARQQVFLDW